MKDAASVLLTSGAKAIDLQCPAIIQMSAHRTAYDCNTDKLSILGTADGKLMPSSCLMVPVMRIDKCVRCCKRDGRECQHGITPVNVH